MIVISNNILIAIVIIVALIVIIVALIVIAIMYFIKRKYDSISEYNKIVADKLNTYKENQDQLSKNLKDSGVESKNKQKIISKIFEVMKTFRGSE